MQVKLFPNFTRHHLVTHTNLPLETILLFCLQLLHVLLKINEISCLKKYASCDPSRSSQEKEVNMEKQKVYTAILSDCFF